jgi:hypothetical protein
MVTYFRTLQKFKEPGCRNPRRPDLRPSTARNLRALISDIDGCVIVEVVADLVAAGRFRVLLRQYSLLGGDILECLDSVFHRWTRGMLVDVAAVASVERFLGRDRRR